MFLSRLDSARNDAEKILSLKAVSSSKKSRILHELSEYLFDLFDANCMEEYRQIEAFENKAIKAFDIDQDERKDGKEYTHEQYELHKEFIALFESFLANFLHTYQYDFDYLYNELAAYKEQDNHGSDDIRNANEIIDVLGFYLSFPAWVNMMRDNAKLRRHYRTFKDNILSVTDNGKK